MAVKAQFEVPAVHIKQLTGIDPSARVLNAMK